MSEQEETQPEPSQLSGQVKQIQGAVYTAIGSVLPTAANAEAWTASGQQLTEDGQQEITNAKQKQAVEATVDGATAKIKSGLGYITGDQEKQTEGNLENEQAQWSFKQATSSDAIPIPVPSSEGIKGKLESVQGIVTGDQELQKEGNIRAEKAAWTDGV
ncbi:hypothetical protein BCR39DRAFT_552669 [Naematelia encephala]|uniref:CsbD-like domain-containing protein n=1 Tax=Naematelia encephala TaxID=71784 RepID=A0A1Y2AIZ9_9TREE|nr:hypothetical protein BCR39DRAFT_552669 [Naematelia encephala]